MSQFDFDAIRLNTLRHLLWHEAIGSWLALSDANKSLLVADAMKYGLTLNLGPRATQFDPTIKAYNVAASIEPEPDAKKFLALTSEEAQNLVRLAIELESDEDGRGTSSWQLLRSLAAFRPDAFSGLYPELTAAGILHPAEMYQWAPAETRDWLMERAEGVDNDLRLGFLTALAWIPDAEVTAYFAELSQSPEWSEDRACHAPEVAGWEIDGNSRRSLIQPASLALQAAKTPPDPTTAPLRAFVPLETPCKWCQSNLGHLFEIRARHIRVSALGLPVFRLNVPFCPNCSAFSPFYAKVDSRGAAAPHPNGVEPDAFKINPALRGCFSMEGFTGLEFEIGPPRVTAWETIHLNGYQGSSNLGGHPSFVSSEPNPKCIECSRTMPFLGQVSEADLDYGDGSYYAFFCGDCLVTAVTYQQS